MLFHGGSLLTHAHVQHGLSYRNRCHYVFLTPLVIPVIFLVEVSG